MTFVCAGTTWLVNDVLLQSMQQRLIIIIDSMIEARSTVFTLGAVTIATSHDILSAFWYIALAIIVFTTLSIFFFDPSKSGGAIVIVADILWAISTTFDAGTSASNRLSHACGLVYSRRDFGGL